jgi:MFS transporter, MHS family, proline/betaine transporter
LGNPDHDPRALHSGLLVRWRVRCIHCLSGRSVAADAARLLCNFNIAALGFSSVLAGVAGMLVGGLLSPVQVLAWGWRLPFIFGLCVILVSLYIRRIVPEETADRTLPRSPIREAIAGHSRYLLLGIGAFVLVTVANYCLAFYLPTYAVRDLGLPPVSAFAGTLLI